VRAPLAWLAGRLGQPGEAPDPQAPIDERVAANVRGLGDLQLSALMVERTAIAAIREDATLEEARARFIASGHSRLLVYCDTLDHVTGVAFAFDLFDHPASLADLTRPAFFVRLDMPVDALLREMITRHHSLAVVMDDFGGTAGLVAREDLLEALFGDIQDEFDADDVLARRAGPDTVIALGRADLPTLEARFGVRLPPGEYETVAGFLLDRLGRIPKPGETFEEAGYRLSVLDATASRVDTVRIARAERL
jgi:CBS domain containing-hemolysin-like protein